MKIVFSSVLIVLIFLAVSSGVTKIMLMPQEVDFFGKHGFSNPILIAFGLVQLIGGILMVIRKIRFIGATVVAITFLISLAVLLMDGNIPVNIATFVAILLLGMIMKRSRNAVSAEL